MARWQLQDAKARFSQVVKSAQLEGPQEITVHGEPAAVLLSAEDYQRLAGPKLSFGVPARPPVASGFELSAGYQRRLGARAAEARGRGAQVA